MICGVKGLSCGKIQEMEKLPLKAINALNGNFYMGNKGHLCHFQKPIRNGQRLIFYFIDDNIFFSASNIFNFGAYFYS